MMGKKKQSKEQPGTKKETGISVEGEVLRDDSQGRFTVRLDDGREVSVYSAGKMRKNFIRIIPGDRVVVELSVYDLDNGRITYRYK
jgi:translation initiation factor IF-1